MEKIQVIPIVEKALWADIIQRPYVKRYVVVGSEILVAQYDVDGERQHLEPRLPTDKDDRLIFLAKERIDYFDNQFEPGKRDVSFSLNVAGCSCDVQLKGLATTGFVFGRIEVNDSLLFNIDCRNLDNLAAFCDECQNVCSQWGGCRITSSTNGVAFDVARDCYSIQVMTFLAFLYVNRKKIGIRSVQLIPKIPCS